MPLEVGSVVARLSGKFDESAFDRFEYRLQRARLLARNDIKVNLDADASGAQAALERFRRQVQQAETDSKRLRQALDALGQAGDSAGDNLGGSNGLAGGLSRSSLSLSAMLPLVGSMIPALVACAGAATALAGSLAAAAAGAGAVVVGFGAALGPLAALGGAIIGRVNLIGEAYKALGAQQEKSGADATAHAEAQHSAALRVAAAQDAVKDATRAERDAREGLTEAQWRARREIEDLTRAVNQSVVSEERAGLTLRELTLRLRELETDPSATGLDVEKARNDVKAARAEAENASRATARAREDMRRGTDTVRTAEDALSAATRQRTRAQAAAAEATRAAGVAAEKQSASATAADVALSKLSASERRLLTTFRGFGDSFRKAFAPATDAIFNGVDGALRKIEPLLGRFSGRFTGIGRTIGDMISHAAGRLAGPEWTRALDSFIATTGKIVRPLGNAFGSVMEILRDIAVAAQPYVIEFARWMERALGGIADKTGDARNLSRIIGDLVTHTRSWARFMGAVAGLVVAVFGGGKEEGKSFLDTMTRVVERWTRFLNTSEGQKQMRDFFRDSVARVRDLWRVVSALADAFFDVLGVINRHQTTFAIVTGGLVALGAAAVGIPALIAAIGTVLVVVYNKSRTFREVVEFVFQRVRKAIGVFVDGILGTLTTLLGGFSSFLSFMSKIPGVGGAFKTAAKGIDAARDAIDGLREGIRETTDPMGAFAKNAETMRSKVHGSFNDLRKDVAAQIKRIKAATLDGSDESKKALQTNFRLAADAVERQVKRMGGSTESGMKKVHRLMVDALHAYGLKAEDAHKLFPNYEDRVAGSLAAGPPAPRRASGGWVGQRGQMGRDSITLNVPGDAAVLNRHQIPFAELALAMGGRTLSDIGLRSTGGGATTPVVVGAGEFMVDPAGIGVLDRALQGIGAGGLDNLFATVQTPHYMATGGIVPIPWAPGEEIAASVLPLATKMHRMFGVGVSDAFDRDRSANHKSPGHNVTGTAVDFTGSPAATDNVARWAAGQGYTVYYDGRFGTTALTGHGPGHHVHVEFGSKGAAVAGSEVATSMGAKRQVIPPVRVDRRSGLLSMAGQGAVNIARRGAQGLLDRARPPAGAALGVAVGAGVKGGGRPANAAQIRSWLYKGLRLAGVPPTSANIDTLFGRVMQESGGDPSATNNWDSNAKRGDPSRGLLQTIGATFRAYMVPGHGNVLNPVDNVAAAVRYMLARYGRLVGRSPTGAGYASGGRVRAKAKRLVPRLSAKDDKAAKQRIARGNAGIVDYEDQITYLEAQYNLENRRADLDPDDFLVEHDDGSVTIDESVRADRASELGKLRKIRETIRARVVSYIAAVKRAIKAYRDAITMLRRALKAATGKARTKERAGYKDTIEAYGTRVKELAGTLSSLGLDVQDADIDLAELDREIQAVSPSGAAAGVKAATAAPEERGVAGILSEDEEAAQARIGMATSLARLTADTVDDEAARAQGESFWRGILARLQGAGAAPGEITQAADALAGFLPQGAAANPALAGAEAVMAEVSRQAAARANLFGSYGRNFTAEGAPMFPGDLGQAAGTRYFGAGSTGGSVLGAGGGVVQNVYVTLNDPGDTHVFTSSSLWEMQNAI